MDVGDPDRDFTDPQQARFHGFFTYSPIYYFDADWLFLPSPTDDAITEKYAKLQTELEVASARINVMPPLGAPIPDPPTYRHLTTNKA